MCQLKYIVTLVATSTDWFQPCAMLLSDIETELKSFGLKLLCSVHSIHSQWKSKQILATCMSHMCIAAFRLGLRSRLVALNARNNSSTEIGLFMIPVCRKYKLFALYLILKNFVLVKGMELSTLNKTSSKIKNGAREMH